MHPAEKRAWLQTGGLAVDPIHRDLRDEFDRVHDVVYIGGGCFRLRDLDGTQVGLVQFQASAQGRIDRTVAETTERLAKGEEKLPDIVAGDTVIRQLDMSDPIDRAMAQLALSKGGANVITPDDERQDPPPIDLPDYVPDDDRSEREYRPGDHVRWDGKVVPGTGPQTSFNRKLEIFALAIIVLVILGITARNWGLI